MHYGGQIVGGEYPHVLHNVEVLLVARANGVIPDQDVVVAVVACMLVP